jgi:hypothetical protein
MMDVNKWSSEQLLDYARSVCRFVDDPAEFIRVFRVVFAEFGLPAWEEDIFDRSQYAPWGDEVVTTREILEHVWVIGRSLRDLERPAEDLDDEVLSYIEDSGGDPWGYSGSEKFIAKLWVEQRKWTEKPPVTWQSLLEEYLND